MIWAPFSSARLANVCRKLWNVRFPGSARPEDPRAGHRRIEVPAEQNRRRQKPWTALPREDEVSRSSLLALRQLCRSSTTSEIRSTSRRSRFFGVPMAAGVAAGRARQPARDRRRTSEREEFALPHARLERDQAHGPVRLALRGARRGEATRRSRSTPPLSARAAASAPEAVPEPGSSRRSGRRRQPANRRPGRASASHGSRRAAALAKILLKRPMSSAPIRGLAASERCLSRERSSSGRSRWSSACARARRASDRPTPNKVVGADSHWRPIRRIRAVSFRRSVGHVRPIRAMRSGPRGQLRSRPAHLDTCSQRPPHRRMSSVGRGRSVGNASAWRLGARK